MSSFIKNGMSELGITITPDQIRKVMALVIDFETRGTHPLTLNSQLIGVYPITFTPTDKAALFTVFKTSEAAIAHIISKIKIPTRISTAVKQFDQKISGKRAAADKNKDEITLSDFKVAGDPYNVLCIWLMHLSFLYIQREEERNEFIFLLAKLLNYKFFTSLIKKFMKHGATESVMIATVNSLNMKFDLKVYKTWKAVIEDKCHKFYGDDALHTERLKSFDDDIEVIYVLSDIQSRIRDKIKKIAVAYYDMKEKGSAITNRASTTTDMDGEKILVSTRSITDAMITNITSELTNPRMFVDDAIVKNIIGFYSSVSYNLLKSSLIMMTDLAASQSLSKELDKVETIDGEKICIGVRALVTNIIQQSFHYVKLNNVDLSSKAKVFKSIKDVYSSSRTSDPNIVMVKNSTAYFVENLGKTSRATTVASLRLSVILYVVWKCFKYL